MKKVSENVFSFIQSVKELAKAADSKAEPEKLKAIIQSKVLTSLRELRETLRLESEGETAQEDVIFSKEVDPIVFSSDRSLADEFKLKLQMIPSFLTVTVSAGALWAVMTEFFKSPVVFLKKYVFAYLPAVTMAAFIIIFALLLFSCFIFFVVVKQARKQQIAAFNGAQTAVKAVVAIEPAKKDLTVFDNNPKLAAFMLSKLEPVFSAVEQQVAKI